MPSYIALVHKDEGTSYGVSFPDVPGCVSAGDTLDEALENAAEALAGHLALMQSDGDTVPQARSLDAIRSDPELAGEVEGALVHEVDLDANTDTRRASESTNEVQVNRRGDDSLLPRLHERDIDVLLQEELIFNPAAVRLFAEAVGISDITIW